MWTTRDSAGLKTLHGSELGSGGGLGGQPEPGSAVRGEEEEGRKGGGGVGGDLPVPGGF